MATVPPASNSNSGASCCMSVVPPSLTWKGMVKRMVSPSAVTFSTFSPAEGKVGKTVFTVVSPPSIVPPVRASHSPCSKTAVSEGSLTMSAKGVVRTESVVLRRCRLTGVGQPVQGSAPKLTRSTLISLPVRRRLSGGVTSKLSGKKVRHS